MNIEGICLITFDCYGTLIDWETGMLAGLRPLLGPNPSDAEILKHYGEVEAELEAGSYLRYREVLARAAKELGRRFSASVSDEAAERFADSLTTWEPFSDTVTSLKTLSERFQLGIISNVDDDLFSETRKKLRADFAVVVTAQQVQSYKPSLRNFEEMLRRSGVPKQNIVHAGQSVYHDVIPAKTLGLRSVWVDRPSRRPGIGAVIAAQGEPDLKVHSLAELAHELGARTGTGQAAS